MTENRTPDARSFALDVLMAWERHRRPLDPILHRALERSNLPDIDRALGYALVTGTVRWMRPLREEASTLVDRPFALLPPAVRVIVLLGLFQIRHLDRVPAYAAVSTAVDLARLRGHRGTAGLVNAVLRRAVAEGPPPPPEEADPGGRLAGAFSFPDWMARRWVERWGQERASTWMGFCNTVAPLTIRVQGGAEGRAAALAKLSEAGIAALPATRSPAGIILGEGVTAARIDDAIPGLWMAQDEAAQMVSPLLRVRPGERVLDGAASPGGKTAHLFDQMKGQGELVAVDRSPERVRLLRGTLGRLGMAGVKVVLADLLTPPEGWRGRFDAVLLDAPCSGLGTIRRHPDIKWTRSPGDIPRLAAEQQRLLASCMALVAPGGRLVYSTCSTEPEENAAVVEVVAESTGARIDPITPEEAGGPELLDGPWLLTAPMGGMDGFFAGRLVR